jgi:hypothetical protein
LFLAIFIFLISLNAFISSFLNFLKLLKTSFTAGSRGLLGLLRYISYMGRNYLSAVPLRHNAIKETFLAFILRVFLKSLK